MASAYLSKTAAGAGNNTTGTFSCWFKRANSGTTQRLYQHTTDSDHFMEIGINGSDKLFMYCYDNPTNIVYLATSQVFRDFNGWYHVVAAFDSTQSTNTDRAKLYINGQQVTSFSTSTYPSSQSADLFFNKSGQTQYIASNYQSGYRWDGKIAHLHWADGQFYDASVFGQTDSNGVWIPKTSPTVSYGTNGHFIKFDNDSNMGLDSSGQSNNFTASGSVIQVKDTPTNIYPVFNILNNYWGGSTFTDVNTTVYTGSAQYGINKTTIGVDSGKWYWEVKIGSNDGSGNNWYAVGISGQEITNSNQELGKYQYQIGYYGDDGTIRKNSVNLSTGTTYTTNDIIGVAMDLDNNKIYFHKNGVYVNTVSGQQGNPNTGANGFDITADPLEGFYFPCVGDWDNNNRFYFHGNFGSGYFGTTKITSAGSNGNGSLFEYDVPTGYYAINTENIKDQS